jgi:alkylhydroperoxidase family enzyme
LAAFSRAVVEQRGWVSEAEQEAFLAAGFTPRQLLDVVAIAALKTLSNYVNHLAHTPLDPAFEAHRWTKPR